MKKTIKTTISKSIDQKKVSMSLPQEPGKRSSLVVKLVFVLGIISLFVYGNTLKNGFALDDYSAIINNTIVPQGIKAIPQLLLTPYHWGNGVTSTDLYRPLSLIMFAIEYQFFGNNALPGHLVNILLFAGCVILLFIFLDKLFLQKKTAVAFMTAAIFALHPIHTEVVANIKSCDELLCFFFAFLSMNLFIKYVESGRVGQLVLGSMCYLLSFLAKETVVTFIAVIPLVFFFYRNEQQKRSIHIVAGTLLAAAICLTVRVLVLSHYNAKNAPEIDFMDNIMAAKNLPVQIHLATAFYTLGLYIKLLLIPYPLMCDYSYNTIPLVDFSNILALASLAFYVFLIVFSVRRFLKNRKDAFVFGILFFLITISLFTNIPFLIGTTMGERLVFFPSIGFCLVIALVVEMLVGTKDKTTLQTIKSPKVLVVIIPIAIIYSLLTMDRNSDWLDNYTLYSVDLKKAPEDSRLNYFVGFELENHLLNEEKDLAKQKNIREEAIGLMKRSVQIHPEYADAQAALADAYYNNFQYDSAVAHSLLALQYIPHNAQALFTLAGTYIAVKKYPAAIDVLKRMLALNPDAESVHVRIGDAYLYNGQYDSSEVHDKRALEINPKNSDAMNNLAGVYFYNKKYPQAIEVYKRAITAKPEFVDPYTNIAACYLYMVKYDSAIAFLNKAITINPNYAPSYEIMAVTYKSAGKLDSAGKYAGIARKNNPAFQL